MKAVMIEATVKEQGAKKWIGGRRDVYGLGGSVKLFFKMGKLKYFN